MADYPTDEGLLRVTFGSVLKQLRENQGLTVRKLEELSGVSASHVTNVENGKRSAPSPDILEKLAEPLGVSYPHLMELAGYIEGGDLALAAALISKNTPNTNHDAHKALLDFMHNQYVAKNTDYGNSFSETFERFGLTAPIVRMWDKLQRVETLSKQDARVKDESIRDTLLDLANYAIMSVIELDKRKS